VIDRKFLSDTVIYLRVHLSSLQILLCPDLGCKKISHCGDHRQSSMKLRAVVTGHDTELMKMLTKVG
jgi:hypothetical protein